MEWIETTGKTIEEAKEAALDELGVDEQDAEFETVAEPKTGLFGRMRVEARVRARVQPTAPRPKEDRRDRRRKGRVPEHTAGGTEQGGRSTAAVATVDRSDETIEAGSGAVPDAPGAASAVVTRAPAATGAPATAAVGSEAADNGRGARRGPDTGREERDDRVTHIDVPLEEQGQAAREFLAGLLGEFGLTAEITVSLGDEDAVELAVTGDNLGLLIGPKGTTLLALQDLTRSAVQQKTNAGNGRIHVDVAGYRQKRSEALVRFANQVAETVRGSGARQALEPMSAVDRKVIHDALAEAAGVSTVSEGEDAQRRVVIVPAPA